MRRTFQITLPGHGNGNSNEGGVNGNNNGGNFNGNGNKGGFNGNGNGGGNIIWHEDIDWLNLTEEDIARLMGNVDSKKNTGLFLLLCNWLDV